MSYGYCQRARDESGGRDKMSAWVPRGLSDRSCRYRPTPMGFSSSVALWLTIRSLLYRLLIICAHLQRRHSALGYLLPLADLMLSASSVPPPTPIGIFLIGKPFRADASLSLSLYLYFLSLFFPSRSLCALASLSSLPNAASIYSIRTTHYNYQKKGSEVLAESPRHAGRDAFLALLDNSAQ